MTTGTYVTPSGLQIPSLQDILDQMTADQRSDIDPLLNTDPDSPVGQLNGTFASQLRTAWEILQVAFNGNNPDAAEGALLEMVSAITGTTRAPATPSTFDGTRKLRVNLNPGTTVPTGSHMHVAGDPTISFHTTEDVTGTGGSPADYFVSAACDVNGPVQCNAGTLTVISSPVAGWNSVTNDFDAVPGTNEDEDPDLRIRRETELRATGNSTIDAITADLFAIKLPDGSKPVVQVVILENVTDTTDGNGLPGHSLEPLVYDGISAPTPNNQIAQTIWDSKPAGIQVVGSSTGNAVDTQGTSQVVNFSRPTISEVILEATLTLVNSNQVPADYLEAVQDAVITKFTSDVKMGSVIRCTHYVSVIVDIPGILDVTVRIGFLSVGLQGPGINLPLAVRQIGFIQSTGITVV